MLDYTAAYYNYAFVQVNTKIIWYYNFQSFGTKNKASELQLGAGVECGFGKKDSIRNNFIGLAETICCRKILLDIHLFGIGTIILPHNPLEF